ncbi:MAG: hypothetical protein B7Y36_15830 [Novosphingobium sp. 28-62-57]|uniref:FliM/FliN family flagellar motor switch protein n=1 Tax=unclassified Novosphingobium TaxID=2644732 RepID=UPI000BC6FD73|nr:MULTISPECIES: FliM/FliN family flagellar motor switch protein [unclassified Novosphingobium]OYW47591.1 MAG: hypothetical protein B7Z36_02935 [Novosphingobium sp. 12-63-9]OYZ08822.1 MAG: hypothetical protein B7Y36_15830 [Novosphingobium sp. 28-62-57]OZA36274.1 MAG: hypothetical protein B7X92_07010 [Novosphingobium sp. 17-62-9]HQS69922.1 FliM/FliN family flagellar motor switch protein [Novosphingobium sp.]
MKPERAFIAERAVAQHDAVLLRPAPDTAELIPALTRMSERLAKAVRGALAPLLGGVEPQVQAVAPTKTDFADFCFCIPPLAANSLMQIGSAPFMMTVEGVNVLRLVDRAFGGPGDAPASLPREFPLSAELMIARIEQSMATCLALALNGMCGPIRALRRDASLAQLQAMPDSAQVANLTLNVLEKGRPSWAISMAFPMDTLAQMFAPGAFAPGSGNRAAKTPRSPARPTDAPFADMPINLTAVLVDMALPLDTIARLEVGQVLPVPIARNVPLVVGDKTYAHGSIGAIEDRVAIQISQLS